MQNNAYLLAMNSSEFISRLKLRRCAELGSSPSVVGRIWIHGNGTLRIGNRVRLDASGAPIEFYVGSGAEMILGDNVEIQGGTSIEALQSVQIGDECKIGARCKVLDNNFHQLGKRLEKPQSAPVVIGAGVTLKDGAIVLPGARVRAGSVITRSTVVRGRPAASAAEAEQREGTAPSVDPHPHLVRRLLKRLQRNPRHALSSIVALVRGAIVLRNCQRGGRVYAYGPVRVKNQGTIQLGKRVGFVRGMLPSELICHPGAEIRIGDGTNFNNATVEAHESVTIGERCMIAPMVRLADRSEGASGSLTIADDVWIAHGAVIMPGISIGSGSVISAGAVVTKEVPPQSLVIGNPARCMSLSLFGAANKATP
jgi:acetyltransferase-like isoleucine patch superfamily enzyme